METNYEILRRIGELRGERKTPIFDNEQRRHQSVQDMTENASGE